PDPRQLRWIRIHPHLGPSPCLTDGEAVLPLPTERLAMRMMRMNDAAALSAYRDLPEIARYQSWPMPFTVDDARQMLHDQDEVNDLPPRVCEQACREHSRE